MTASEIMQELLALAAEANLEVRVVGRQGGVEGESPPTSAVCRVRGAVWVVLSAADPVEVQLDVLAKALRANAGELLETRYLPPAVRQRLYE
jgi:hypothetical protein